MPEILSAYTWLTGRIAPPPVWALGYHQCRWFRYTQTHVERIAERHRQISIGGREHPAVEVKAHHLRHEFGRSRVARRRDVCGELGDFRRHAEQGPWWVRRVQQPADHRDPLGDHQTATAGTVRAAVGHGEITEVG